MAATVRGETEVALRAALAANPVNCALLKRLPDLDLPDCWLVAGCLFQALWNVQTGRAAASGIKDYDVFYHDPRDLSYEAEDAVIQRVVAATADLGVPIEVKNQARVHLWYRARFGSDYPRLMSSRDGIDRFLIRSTCIGLGAGRDNHEVLYATYGLDETRAGVLAPNPLNAPQSRYLEKALSYRARWPHLVLADAAVAADG